MKSVSSALLGLAVLAQTTLAHVAILPPFPDKRITPNSTEAPAGCRLLPSDKGWPHPQVFKDAFPDVFKKMNGTYGPDYMLQVTSVKEVQAAVNFAREHNIRLSIVTTGHDFGGRSEARSGIRVDLSALRDPTVFSNTWECGKTLKPRDYNDEEFHGEVMTCGVKKEKAEMSRTVAGRNNEFVHFEKREGWDCDRLMNMHRKRQMEGMSMGGMDMGDDHLSMMGGPKTFPDTNVIKVTGDHAYARVSAGIYNEMFFTQASKSGLMTLGAQHNGVSVTGGWFQAGGHNPFANRYGMQADNVVEVEVVTADGKFHKVSECNEPDLFWALRGGGGGTYGIVTGATVKVFPTFPVIVSRFFVNSTSKAGIAKASAYFLQEGSKLRDKYGLQGYFYIYPGSFQSVLHMPDTFATMENAKAVTEPLMKKMEELAGSTHSIKPMYQSHKTYMDWYVAEMGDEEGEERGEIFNSWSDGSDGSAPSLSQAMANPLSIIPWYIDNPSYPEKRDLQGPVRKLSAEKRSALAQSVMKAQPIPRHYLDSRLLSDKMVNSVSQQKLADAILETMPDIAGVHYRGFLYGGGEMAKKDPESTGLLPAWRDMSYHFIINAVPGSIRRDYDIGPIAKLFPEAGAYVNEASPAEPHWKKVFWGAHYPKLSAIKTKYDPTNVFWCSPCVNADYFTYDDERICKNPNYPEADGVPAPQTYPARFSKTGIASLPGVAGIDQPFIDLITTYELDNKLPDKMLKSSYFKMAMGEGGSAGGKYKDNDPFHPGQKFKAEDWAVN